MPRHGCGQLAPREPKRLEYSKIATTAAHGCEQRQRQRGYGTGGKASPQIGRGGTHRPVVDYFSRTLDGYHGDAEVGVGAGEQGNPVEGPQCFGLVDAGTQPYQYSLGPRRRVVVGVPCERR